MSWILFYLLAWFVGFGLLFTFATQARAGYQDLHGFHDGASSAFAKGQTIQSRAVMTNGATIRLIPRGAEADSRQGFPNC